MSVARTWCSWTVVAAAALAVTGCAGSNGTTTAAQTAAPTAASTAARPSQASSHSSPSAPATHESVSPPSASPLTPLPHDAARYADGLVDAWRSGQRQVAARYARHAAAQSLVEHRDAATSSWRRDRVEGAAGTTYVTYSEGGGAGTLVLAVTNQVAASAEAHAVREARFTTAPSTNRQQARAQARSCPRRVLGQLGLSQRVGELFVMGVDGSAPTPRELGLLRQHHVGGVILMGNASGGVAGVRAVTDRVQGQRATGGAQLWVATDQEGGQVQRLTGPGFSDIPEALSQGRLRPRTLRHDAHAWGRQLHRAGVNVNLAPVVDTVPASLGRDNAPIGAFDREFGHRPRRVAHHGVAFLRGMRSAGVTSAAKHFPGLGRVLENTDTHANVVDDQTTRTDNYLRPFRAAVQHDVGMVMISSARYTRIDDHHLAAFSPTVIRGLLRTDLGFSSVVISDDLGIARAVTHLPPGRRALRFLRAGGTVVLTVSPDTVPPMVHAVLRRARHHGAFHRLVTADALRVLRAKDRAGLLRCS